MNVPDTVAYLFLGLGVVFTVLGVYCLSLVWRFRSAERDLDTIEQLKD